MVSSPKSPSENLQSLVDKQADFIIDNQLATGAIPWYGGGIADPWDHIEGAIALTLSGRIKEAAEAYLWSRNMQNPDGSWYSSYQDDIPQDLTRDSNFATYIATGMWFYYLATKDMHFLRQMWPTVEQGIEFGLSLQQPSGEIYWALSEKGNPWRGALLTSSCCTWHSIRNGINIAEVLGIDKPAWVEAGKMLLVAIREHPDLFDRMGENQRRYSMSWFYPILTEATKGEEAKTRIEKEWGDYIIDGWGCRVAADEDVTAVAETSELIIALCLIGEQDKGRLLLDWTLRLQDDEGGFCRGIKLPEKETFPKERATWTSAALIMAIAALSRV